VHESGRRRGALIAARANSRDGRTVRRAAFRERSQEILATRRAAIQPRRIDAISGS